MRGGSLFSIAAFAATLSSASAPALNTALAVRSAAWLAGARVRPAERPDPVVATVSMERQVTGRRL